MTYSKSIYRQSKVIRYHQIDGWPWSTPSTSQSSQTVPVRDFDGTYGEGGADWRNAIANVTQAGTEMSITDVRRRPCSDLYAYGESHDSLGNAHVEYYYGRFWYAGLPTLVSVATSSEDAANALALTNYMKRIRNALTSVEGLVIAGEIMQTVRLLKNPLRSFRTLLDKYHSTTKNRLRRVRSKQSRSRIVADTWLEYAFGWTPLVNDIDDISQYLAEQTVRQGPPPHKVVNGVGTDAKSGTKGNHLWLRSVDHVAVKGNITRSHKTTVVYKGAVRTDKYQEYSHRSLGFGLDNFVPSLWELIPYSFLVDYFTNVGEFVNAVTFNSKYLGWTMKWVIVEDKTRASAFVPRKAHSNPLKYQNMSVAGRGMSEVSRSIERAPYTGSLIPPLRFEIPGLGGKWLNIAALARLRS